MTQEQERIAMDAWKKWAHDTGAMDGVEDIWNDDDTISFAAREMGAAIALGVARTDTDITDNMRTWAIYKILTDRDAWYDAKEGYNLYDKTNGMMMEV